MAPISTYAGIGNKPKKTYPVTESASHTELMAFADCLAGYLHQAWTTPANPIGCKER